jgi:glycosyltransferase involved in cell wall biosynthesis
VKLAVALTFQVHPPLGGGQVRVFHLYRELARHFEVELVTLADADATAGRIQIAPGLWERRVPKSARHVAEELALEREVGTVVTDVAMPRLHRLTPDYEAALRAACLGADGVVAVHPYTLSAIRAVSDAPLLYEAQDVEASLKADVLGEASEASRSLLREVEECERRCCQEAELVWTCSDEDREELIGRYAADPARIAVAPNGAALDEALYASPSEREARRRALRLNDRFLAAFVASWHQPNIAAAKRLLELAAGQPSVDFLIMGSVGQALAEHIPPRNVDVMGVVSAGLKDAVLGTVNVALNPVTSGSGTNLKMLEYFATGVPVISTAFGARGLEVTAGEHYLEASPWAFAERLEEMRRTPVAALDAMAETARRHVEAEMSWTMIAERLRTSIEAKLSAHAPA